jgi:hypothetical protein
LQNNVSNGYQAGLQLGAPVVQASLLSATAEQVGVDDVDDFVRLFASEQRGVLGLLRERFCDVRNLPPRYAFVQ